MNWNLGCMNAVHPELQAWRRTVDAVVFPAVAYLLISSISFGRCRAADAPALAVAEWPMFRGTPQQTGLVAGDLPEKLKVLWKFEAGDAVTSTAAIVESNVYFGCDDGYLYSLELASGKLRWKYTTDDMIRSSPTVVGQSVFFGDSEGIVHAVDTKNGKQKWTFETMGEIISSANYDTGRLIVGSYDGFVYCLSAEDGTLLWKHETAGRVHGTPAISDGLVAVAGCDEFLRVLRLKDGELVSKVSMNSVSGASVSIGGKMAFVGTYGGSVLGIDWKSSTVRWRYQDAESEFPFMSSAALGKQMVVLGGRDKRVHALDAETGKQKWEFVTKGRVESSPVIVKNRVFVGSSDGNLYEIDLTTGKERWRFEAGAPISASPAIAHKRLVIGTEDGLVYCFGAR